jgi:hypothetical protein
MWLHWCDIDVPLFINFIKENFVFNKFSHITLIETDGIILVPI